LISADGKPNVDLLIVGASTRSAAFAALRSGFHPLCLDQYADTDLQAQAPVQRISDLGNDLAQKLARLPSLPLLYVGGMENQPEVLKLMASRHVLWGNDAGVVAHVRNPRHQQEAARLARVGFPDWRDEERPPQPDGSWLIRPSLGSGGRGIQVWQGPGSTETLNEPHFFQRYVHGNSYSATFIADPATGDVRFVGVTSQLVGEPVCHARPFQWCGNIGPVSLSIPVESVVRRFANVLKWKFGIKGLFGIDFVVDVEDKPWVVEVNPRYPASVELLEHATGTPLLVDHCRCFQTEGLPSPRWNRPHPGEFLGKAILFSPQDLQISAPLANPGRVPVFEYPQIADLPAVGEQLKAGDPVCTVYATAGSALETGIQLQQKLAQVEANLLSSTM